MQQELIEMLEKVLNWYDYIGSDSYYAKDTGELVKEAEALIEKAKNNAPAVPQGEPVAYLWKCRKKPELREVSFKKHNLALESIGYKATPLYATPAPAPAQEVGLIARQFDLICQAIDKADTITMEGDYMLDSDDCISVVRVMQALFDIEALRAKENKL